MNPNKNGRITCQPDNPQPGLNESVHHKMRPGMTIKAIPGKAMMERKARKFKPVSCMSFSV
jgi:hypothetical protein